MNILTVGSVAYDKIVTPFDVRERALGGSATYFSLSARHFAPVRLVAVIGEDFSLADEELLEHKGVDLEGLEKVPGKCFFWSGEYLPNWNNRITHATHLNVFEHFNPKIPVSYRNSEVLFLGNIHPALQLQVLNQVERPRLIALDTMNLWIDITREALVETLAKVDLLLLNDSEASQLSGETQIIRAAKAIMAMGPSTVCIKRGEYGALLVQGERIFAVPAYPLCNVVDPTGAGDAFAGGFLGYLAANFDLDFANLKRAVVYGSVMGSFTVEAFSVDRCAAVTRDEIEARYRAFVELTHFDG